MDLNDILAKFFLEATIAGYFVVIPLVENER